MNKDLTVGKPETVLWKFCLPLFGSIIFQQLYNIADSLVAGKFIGENALAAVGNSYEVTLIFIAFAFGCNIGCSVIVSQLFGAKEYGRLKTAVSTACIFSAFLCSVLMLFGIFGCSPLLQLIRTPKEVFSDSKLYLDIYIWGLPFVFFYNISTGIFSALGDSKTPFYFLAASSTSNIAVDILFVKAFSMGVAGYSASVKLNNLVITSFTTIGNGISNFSAQNLGAHKYGRIKECFRAGIKMVWYLCIPFCILYIFFGKYLLLLFMEKGSDAALMTGRQFLWILSPFYFVISVKLVADGILHGISAMHWFMAATFTDLILRVVLAFVLSGWTKSAIGIWSAWPIGWTVSMVLSVFFYCKEYRKYGTD